MAYTKTVWKDEIVQHPKRFTATENDDGTLTLEPAFGTTLQEGTPVNAANLNNIEEGIASTKQDIANMVGSSDANSDLDIADSSGYVIARFANGDIKTKRFDSGRIVQEKIVTVKTDGTGDFTSIRSAVSSITDANYKTNPYVIHVYEGTYNVLEDFTDAELATARSSGYANYCIGIRLTDGISLVGIGAKERIILKAEMDLTKFPDASNRHGVSTLNTIGSCRVENMTLIAVNIRYCIHDDFATTQYIERYVRDVDFRIYGECAYKYNPVAYGASSGVGGGNFVFERCRFNGSFGMHNRTAQTHDANIYMRDCIGVRFTTYDYATVDEFPVNHYRIDSSEFYHLNISQADGTEKSHFDISGTGNKNTMIACGGSTIYETGNIRTMPNHSDFDIADHTFVKRTNTVAGYQNFRYYADSVQNAVGYVIASDDDFKYIQIGGFLNNAQLGISLNTLNAGDYIGIGSDHKAVKVTSEAESVGVVVLKDNDHAYIKMNFRG